MPTLDELNTFSFYPNAVTTPEQQEWLKTKTAMEIITLQLQSKLQQPLFASHLYFLRGRTGSGKSTFMISSLFKSIAQPARKAIMCAEPRVVLTKANASDVIRYNPSFQFGVNMGILTGSEKIKCNKPDHITYCTPQILNDALVDILNQTDETLISRNLSRYKIIVIDEVHVLDLPVLSLIKTARDVVRKFYSHPSCPIFILTSATINLEDMVKYFFQQFSNLPIPDYKTALQDPLLIGDVAGKPNFSVEELFIEDKQMAIFNQQESDANNNGVRGECFRIMAKFFCDYLFRETMESKSYITNPITNKEVQCRDVLIFVPLVSGIDIMSKSVFRSLRETFTTIPIFIITQGLSFTDVQKWREHNRGKRRILIIGFARDYSSASDILLSKPIDDDDEALENETKIVIATPVIETGKTISTLYQCIDMGLNTTSVINPLVYNFNDVFEAIRQIPINMNQAIQRLGRVGREASGMFVHFYTRDVMKKFQPTDMPDTINNAALSGVLMQHFTQEPIYTVFDVMNENKYLYPTSTDILVRSMRDLVKSGMFTVYGEMMCLKTGGEFVDIWILYAVYLFYILKYPLFLACVVAAVNRKVLPQLYNIAFIDPTKLKYKLKDIMHGSNEPYIIEGIAMGSNLFNFIKYSSKSKLPLGYIAGRDYVNEGFTMKNYDYENVQRNRYMYG